MCVLSTFEHMKISHFPPISASRTARGGSKDCSHNLKSIPIQAQSLFRGHVPIIRIIVHAFGTESGNDLVRPFSAIEKSALICSTAG